MKLIQVRFNLFNLKDDNFGRFGDLSIEVAFHAENMSAQMNDYQTFDHVQEKFKIGSFPNRRIKDPIMLFIRSDDFLSFYLQPTFSNRSSGQRAFPQEFCSKNNS